jgi:Tol biopolymer transport system component
MAVVGAPGMAKNTGTAYVYERSGTRWTKEAVLPDPRGAPSDYYAWAVAISSTKSGNYVAVGGNDANGKPDRVYIYKGSGKTWHIQQTINDIGGQSSDMFGDAIAISGNTLVVSATCVNNNSGTMYVWLRFSERWTLEATEVDPAGQPNDFFGQSVSISGNEILAGAVDAAYVYTGTPKHHWFRTAVFQNPGSPDDNFGYGVALSGTKAVIGAPGGVPGAEISSPPSAGAAYIYTFTGKTWSNPKELTAPPGDSGDEFGHSVAMTGNKIVIGMPVSGRVSCGSALVFNGSGSRWFPNGQVIDPRCANNDQFGFAVGLSAATAGIGAPKANKSKGAAFFIALPPPERPEAILSHGGRGVPAVAFNPASSVVASGDIDGTTYLWNVRTHKLIRALRNPNRQAVFGDAFSPDGRTLVVGTANNKFTTGVTYLWSIATHKVIATLRDPNTRGIDTAAFSPDGRILAVGDNNGTTCLWNSRTHKLVAVLQDPSGQDVNIVVFSPDGKTLAAADNNSHAYLWNTRTHRLIATFHDPNGQLVNGVAFSPDGKKLAVADNNGSAYLWNVRTRRIAVTLPNPGGQSVQGVVFSPDGRALAGTTTNTQTGQSSILLWAVVPATVIATLHDPGSAGNFRLAFSPDGGTLAIGDSNGATYLWNTRWLS